MRMLAALAPALLLALPAGAHLLETTIPLTAAEETMIAVPPPAAAGGTATIELTEDLTIEYDVTVHDLSSTVIAGHIHPGAPGADGPPLFSLTPTGATSFRGETAALTTDQVTTLLAGGFYVNVHTTSNQGGEVRGQIVDLEMVQGACSCRDLTRGQFLKCVKKSVAALDKPTRKSAAARALKRAAKKSLCGSTQTKRPVACCLPFNGVGEIVVGAMCAPVKKAAQCTHLGGTVVAGKSCAPENPCFLPASPSGAFVDAP